MSSLYASAKDYLAAGLSVIPCSNKRPVIGSWSQYQQAAPTLSDIENMFRSPKADQIAVICGAVSGSLEVIDVDLKNDTTGTLWDLLWNDLLEYFNNSMPLVVVTTKSGGVHLYYRCEVIEGNQKLASVKNKEGKAVVIIETRGEGGYVIAPPSAGYTLPDSASLAAIATITTDQRTDILDICRKYNQVFVTERQKVSNVQASNYKLTPWDAYNQDTSEPWMEVMTDAGWVETGDKDGRTYLSKAGSDNKNKANWNHEKRLLYIFSTSTEFESEKAYTPFAIYAVLKCAGDFAEATRQIRAAGYGQPFSEKEEELIHHATTLSDKQIDPFDIFRILTPEYFTAYPDIKDLPKEEREKKTNEALAPIIRAGAERAAQAKGLFWVKRGKGLAIVGSEIVKFLQAQGFWLFVQESASMAYRLVHIDTDSHIIEEVPVDKLKKWVGKWVTDNIDDYKVSGHELMVALVDFTGWERIIEWLERVSIADISFLRDTSTASYLPFKNGIVHITKDDIRIMEYQELPKNMLLWTNQIKDDDIELVGIEKELDLNQTPVYRFFKRIAGINPDIENLPIEGPDGLMVNYPDKYNNLMSFLTGAGYLLSNYKDPGRPYAYVLAEDTATSREGGGAGKDLFIKCLIPLRSVCLFPAKLWKATDSFAFQRYKLGDDILYLSDLNRNFDFELIYNVVSEGLPIEKKNKDAFMVPYELSPKVVASTNYDVDETNAHAARRLRKLLFAKYYNQVVRPEDELGGMFWGPEWTRRDWMLFYLLLFVCIQTYLDNGVMRFATTENMKAKTIKLKCGEDFYDFISEWITANAGKWVPKKGLYDEFLDDSELERKAYSSRKFDFAMKFYAEVNGYVVGEVRNKSRNVGDRDQKYIIFTKAGLVVPDFAEGTPF